MRRSACIAVAVALAITFACSATALAANPAGFEGTYLGSVHTSNGNDLGAWVQVYQLGDGSLKLVVRVADGPTIPLWPKVQWNGTDSFTVISSVYIPGWEEPLVDGSGTATFVKGASGWRVSGDGNGKALGTSGSASGAGTKVSDDFIEPALKASAAATAAAATANTVDKVLVAVAVAEKQPEISDGEKVITGGLSAVAVIAALILCMAMGATMTGSEFAELMLTE